MKDLLGHAHQASLGAPQHRSHAAPSALHSLYCGDLPALGGDQHSPAKVDFHCSANNSATILF
ncbi:hypothetical protein [Devosia sp.]|uniref:hypothetical protein n=1 Tax=Devosia sp. TaxID=1871048 RepID=UPI001AC2C9E9|nr:hypothetical protein [Devosia sp.]MBN9363005.1 hypothetical protein [Devosia sp.]